MNEGAFTRQRPKTFSRTEFHDQLWFIDVTPGREAFACPFEHMFISLNHMYAYLKKCSQIKRRIVSMQHYYKWGPRCIWKWHLMSKDEPIQASFLAHSLCRHGNQISSQDRSLQWLKRFWAQGLCFRPCETDERERERKRERDQGEKFFSTHRSASKNKVNLNVTLLWGTSSKTNFLQVSMETYKGDERTLGNEYLKNGPYGGPGLSSKPSPNQQ